MFGIYLERSRKTLAFFLKKKKELKEMNQSELYFVYVLLSDLTGFKICEVFIDDEKLV